MPTHTKFCPNDGTAISFVSKEIQTCSACRSRYSLPKKGNGIVLHDDLPTKPVPISPSKGKSTSHSDQDIPWLFYL